MVYGDYLYIGEYNDEEIALESVLFDIDFDFVNENLRQSVSLYRMDKDENIELVVGDPRLCSRKVASLVLALALVTGKISISGE